MWIGPSVSWGVAAYLTVTVVWRFAEKQLAEITVWPGIRPITLTLLVCISPELLLQP